MTDERTSAAIPLPREACRIHTSVAAEAVRSPLLSRGRGSGGGVLAARIASARGRRSVSPPSRSLQRHRLHPAPWPPPPRGEGEAHCLLRRRCVKAAAPGVGGKPPIADVLEVATGAVVLACLAATGAAAQPSRLLGELFADHAVLQRDRPIAVWGDAIPGEEVTVALAGAQALAVADDAGRWRATLPAMVAGGPHVLTATAASGPTETTADVLIGDVWLCAGQSNMELPVSRTLDAARNIARSEDDAIRLLTVPRAASPSPRDTLAGEVAWRPAGPESVGGFSAACYYFARELQRAIDAPLGLIQAAWGGSSIETWIGAAGLRAAGGFDDRLDLLALYVDDPAAANAAFGAVWEAWWRGRDPADAAPWSMEAEPGSGWRPVPEPMRSWKAWGAPELAGHDGMVWFRRTIDLTAAQAAQAATLALGAIDEVDETWVNGVPVGNTFGFGDERSYALPAGALREGENVVVVNVLSTWDSGGMFGPAERLALTFADGASVPLAGGWRYQVAPLSLGRPPRAPWEAIAGLASLKHAMIAPLAPYGLRGVAWYQGESDTEAPRAYEGLLGALMADWRATLGEDLPFLVVQLPNFGGAPFAPTASAWAELRDSQRRAVEADARAALVVTIDVGDPEDLHPPNKQAIGRRLARAARHVAYGEDVTPSGPRVASARVSEAGVEVRFADVEGSLVASSAAQPIAFELCGADQASCRFVAGSIADDRVVLEADGEPASRVRYCWGDAPVCNLYDRSGLPAGPFEIVVEP